MEKVIIVGGGPGGYVAAIRARQVGLDPVIVEKEHLGGVCLNWGCIPTKALLRSAEVAHLLRNAVEYGFETTPLQTNLSKIIERSRAIAGQLSKGVQHLLKKNNIPVIEGHGRLKGPGCVVVAGKDGRTQDLRAPHVILATGAQARTLPNLVPDGKFILSIREAMTPTHLPKTLLIVGSGAIGIEFASFYRALGVDVTVVEIQKRILPQEDEEISSQAQKAFEKRGIRFFLESQVLSIQPKTDSLSVSLSTPQGEKTFEVERIIPAVGVVGNTEDLGLSTTKVRVEKGQIITNEWCQTNEPGVYAIGDVAGPPWLAHKASHEGILCVEKITNHGDPHPLKRDHIPGCTYSFPQIASLGLTEAQARASGAAIRVGRFPFLANGKALALGEKEGMVKTIFDEKTGKLLGAHMIGQEVTELIQTLALAKTLETTEAEIMQTIFPHPTLSEMIHESTLDAYGHAIHI